MNFKQIVIFTTWGSCEFTSDSTKLSIDFTEAELHELQSIAWRALERERARLAQEIAQAGPPLLCASVDAEFTEAPDAQS